MLERLKEYKGKLVIFTSFYEQRAYAAYIRSLVDTSNVLNKAGIDWEYRQVAGDFHVERALNGALTRFMLSDATDFLNIDADESWDVEGILRLLIHQQEVVGGSYRMKNSWSQWTAQIKEPPQGIALGDGTALLAANRLPAGFLRIKKSALEKLAKSIDERYMDGDVEVVPFFQTSIKDGQFFSQDYTFSERLKAIGIDLWVDPNITIGHYGLTEYGGNLDKHLKALKTEGPAFAEVRKMAEEIKRRAA